MVAHAPTDRAAWISFENRGDFEIAVEGDVDLCNQYGVIVVNAGVGQAFLERLIPEAGEAAIAGYDQDGRQLSSSTPS